MYFKNLLLAEGSALPLYHLGLGGKLIVTGILCFLAVIATTVYQHRYRTHNSLKLKQLVAYFFELILWLTTGVQSALWVVLHKFHHKHSDKERDIHSPWNPVVILGFKITGPAATTIKYFALYKNIKDNLINEKIEEELKDESAFSRLVFHRFARLGPVVLLLLFYACFGLSALWMFTVVFLWLPVVAGGGVNGIGHMHHEVHAETRDHSNNLLAFIERLPKWAYYTFSPVWFSLKTALNVMTGGEWRHHVHHFKLNSARLTLKKWEFDIGWTVIYMLWLCRLARDVRYFSETSGSANGLKVLR